MPLIQNFRSTNIWKAFVLNSIVSTLIIFIAITIKTHFDVYSRPKDDRSKRVKVTTNVKSVVLTLGITFLSSMLAYTTLYLIFGFGGGMLTN